jgi:ABC-type lipoprotein export system ATPase subunit
VIVAGAEQTRPDANLYFVGARGGGKSTLLNRILYPNETATPKPTDGIEYSYLRKSAPNSDRKDVANIWEISGADELCADFTASENLFLGMRQVNAIQPIVVTLGTDNLRTRMHHQLPQTCLSALALLGAVGTATGSDAFPRRLMWERRHSGAH